MKRIIQFLKDNDRDIYALLVFIMSIGLLVYIFPKESKFQYEFEKGRPWMHDNLIAPYDFPIYKTEAELKADRDSIINNFPPYYRYKKEVHGNMQKRFLEDFGQTWQIKRAQVDSIMQENAFVQRLQNESRNQKYKRLYQRKILELLDLVYERGILEYSPFSNTNRDVKTIRVIRGDEAERYDYDQIFTLKTAYRFIFDELRKSTIFQGEELKADEIRFAQEMNINRYLQPNLYYNPEITQKFRQNEISNISLTSGMVQKGERIIFRGEVVDDEKLKILKSLSQQYNRSRPGANTGNFILLGHVVLIAFVLFTLYIFMKTFREDIIVDTGKTLFILLMILLFVSVSALILDFNKLDLYLVPYAILPIIIRIFYDTRLALYVHFVTILLVGFLAPNGYEFVLLQFSAGIISIISLKNLTRRSQLFITAGYVMLAYCAIYFAMSIIHEGDPKSVDYIYFVYFAGNGLLLLFTYPLIYLLEKSFGFLSDVTLIELSDSNNELLRSLAEKAPGTFQHSMQVAGLAEECIQKIGGNPLLIRTGALYHDIGKMEVPHYFIENQRLGMNPHDKLEFDQSAEIIISHVTRGVKMAQKYRLPKQVVDFIKTHHGTSKVLYFYRSFKNKYPDENIDIKKFTYPGPKPFSKEMAVLMMADSVEAASRSLKVVSEKTISDLVENIINGQIDNKQFSNADITFKDIHTTKEIFKKKMNNIFHARIEYPDEK